MPCLLLFLKKEEITQTLAEEITQTLAIDDMPGGPLSRRQQLHNKGGAPQFI